MKKMLLLLLLLSGCKVHQTLNYDLPTVCVPCSFLESFDGKKMVGPWWGEFEDPELWQLMDDAFCGNLELAQAGDRYCQARYLAKVFAADRYPFLDLNFNTVHSKVIKGLPSPEIDAADPAIAVEPVGNTNQDLINLTFQVSYEVDLWRRIDSIARASCHRANAAYFDYQATALSVTGQIAEAWFILNEQKELYALLQEQVRVNQTQVELLELRFSVGESSALDVYQQRLILAATKADIPPVVSALITANYRLNKLLGLPPEHRFDKQDGGTLPDVAPLPDTGLPCNLFTSRPDLRASFEELWAADYEVAAAIADRFPRINLFVDYEFTAFSWQSLFQQEVLSVTGNLFQPLIDWGKRKAEVNRTKAVVQERLHGFSELFLQALLEVESSLTQEKEQRNLIALLQEQWHIAESNLTQAQLRYLNGLNDYLTVIAAIQSKQEVERRLISERKNLLMIRADLYRALGGNIF